MAILTNTFSWREPCAEGTLGSQGAKRPVLEAKLQVSPRSEAVLESQIQVKGSHNPFFLANKRGFPSTDIRGTNFL